VRRAARKDDNQDDLVEEARSLWGTVAYLHQLGGGVPDLLVGMSGISVVGLDPREVEDLSDIIKKYYPYVTIHRGCNLLVEVKDGDKAPSRQKLTSDEQVFHDSWRGQVGICRSRTEMRELMGITEQKLAGRWR
jgi:hypothetical protein